MGQVNLFTKQKWLIDIENKLMVTRRERGWHIHTAVYKVDTPQGPPVKCKICACTRPVASDFCSPIDYPARLICHGIFQARILEWVHFLLQGSSRPRDWTCICSIDRSILCHWATSEVHNARSYIQYLVIICHGKEYEKEFGVRFYRLV